MVLKKQSNYLRFINSYFVILILGVLSFFSALHAAHELNVYRDGELSDRNEWAEGIFSPEELLDLVNRKHFFIENKEFWTNIEMSLCGQESCLSYDEISLEEMGKIQDIQEKWSSAFQEEQLADIDLVDNRTILGHEKGALCQDQLSCMIQDTLEKEDQKPLCGKQSRPLPLANSVGKKHKREESFVDRDSQDCYEKECGRRVSSRKASQEARMKIRKIIMMEKIEEDEDVVGEHQVKEQGEQLYYVLQSGSKKENLNRLNGEKPKEHKNVCRSKKRANWSLAQREKERESKKLWMRKKRASMPPGEYQKAMKAEWQKQLKKRETMSKEELKSLLQRHVKRRIQCRKRNPLPITSEQRERNKLWMRKKRASMPPGEYQKAMKAEWKRQKRKR